MLVCELSRPIAILGQIHVRANRAQPGNLDSGAVTVQASYLVNPTICDRKRAEILLLVGHFG